MAKSIQEIVSTLKQGYVERDVTKIDSFMETIFQSKEDLIVIGTSPGELKIGTEQAKKLFVSDFLHWNNVLIGDQSFVVEEFGDVSWVTVKAKIQYHFTDTDLTFKNFYDEVTNISGFDITNVQKGTEMVWLLSHLLHARSYETREYLWDMRIHMLVEKMDEEFVCKMMMFDIPTTFSKTDVMMDNSHHFVQRDEEAAVNAQALFDSMKDDQLDRLFSGIQKEVKEKTETADSITLSKKHFLTQKVGNQIQFYGTAILTDALTLEQRLGHVMNQIQENGFGEDLKDALYRIRRDIAYYLWRYSKGKDTQYPVRYIGVCEEVDGEVKLLDLKLSFPFEVILEQKFDFN